MRRTKPDRWERLTAKYSYIDVGHGDQPDDYAVDASMVAKLLRREHRALVRMVNNCVPNKAWSAVASLGYGQAVEDILNLLEARAR